MWDLFCASIRRISTQLFPRRVCSLENTRFHTGPFFCHFKRVLVFDFRDAEVTWEQNTVSPAACDFWKQQQAEELQRRCSRRSQLAARQREVTGKTKVFQSRVPVLQRGPIRTKGETGVKGDLGVKRKGKARNVSVTEMQQRVAEEPGGAGKTRDALRIGAEGRREAAERGSRDALCAGEEGRREAASCLQSSAPGKGPCRSRLLLSLTRPRKTSSTGWVGLCFSGAGTTSPPSSPAGHTVWLNWWAHPGKEVRKQGSDPGSKVRRGDKGISSDPPQSPAGGSWQAQICSG